MHRSIRVLKKIDQKFSSKPLAKSFVKIVQLGTTEIPLMGIRIAFEDLLCGITKEKYLKSVTGCRKIPRRSRKRKHRTCLSLKAKLFNSKDKS